VKLTIARPLGANGSLFGAVTKEEIANTLNEKEGFEIDKKAVEIDNPIKATGNYNISIKLGHGIHANLNLEVVGE
ncbi:MAG: 50S ribosomal protein L9, partial [Campylobacteraceae bacterium]|nr:50S ribosomal protein L9 [Campylobacteraceae bacterium]